MADELDEFLKQAAQRRMQRQQQKQSPPLAGKPEATSSSSKSNSAKSKPQTSRDLSSNKPDVFQEQTPVANRSLEPSISQRHVSTQIDQRDEGIDAYVRSTIGEASTLGGLQKGSKGKKGSQAKSDERPMVEHRPNDIVGSSELIRQLRDPKTLRMAILAHEILRRPYK